MHLILVECTEAKEREKITMEVECPSPVLEVEHHGQEVGGKVALPFPSPLRESVVKPEVYVRWGKPAALYTMSRGRWDCFLKSEKLGKMFKLSIQQAKSC